jgi:hypothetical protein
MAKMTSRVEHSADRSRKATKSLTEGSRNIRPRKELKENATAGQMGRANGHSNRKRK